MNNKSKASLVRTIKIAKKNNSSKGKKASIEDITESLDNSPIWPSSAGSIKAEVKNKIKENGSKS